jgi:hypothetical protein
LGFGIWDWGFGIGYLELNVVWLANLIAKMRQIQWIDLEN